LITAVGYNNTIAITVKEPNQSIFQHAITLLKQARCRYNPEDHTWITSPPVWERLLPQLEEITSVSSDLSGISEKKELIITPDRILPDYSLLSYPPIIGKEPFEDYQKQDIRSGLQRNRYGYFLGMGTGKTYIAAALIAHYYLKWGKVGKILFITSNIGVRNVLMELQKFIPSLPSERITIADKDNRMPFTDNIDIVVTSYNGFRLVADAYKKQAKITATNPRKSFIPFKKWFGDKEGMLLLDESHQIANPQSKQGYYTALHADDFYYRYLFTGTPADKPEKLYNQFKILDPALVHRYSYTDWLGQYALIGNRFSPFAVTGWRYDELEKLNKKFTNEYGIYRNSVDVVQLPEHYIKHIYVKMSPQHRSIYEEFIQTSLEDTMGRGRQSISDISNMFPYLMLAVENPFLLEKHLDKFPEALQQKLAKFKVEQLEKVQVVRDILEEHEDEQGIIWVSHPHTAKLLAELFEKQQPLVIIGETEKEDREKIIEQFKANKKHKILIASIQVLNTSVTLTNCTWQCYIERVWAYATYEQSQFRIYRIGQDKTVITYLPVYNSSLDVLLDKNLSSKGKLVKGLMSKDFLTQQEWTNIFNMEDRDNAGSYYDS
jgi:SNF2 family DNA or RNA helicase